MGRDPDPVAEDIEVLAAAAAWLRDGRRVALATVLRTWGSSPRPPGSLLAMSDRGGIAGSVSGGCVEEALLARYRDGELALPGPTLVDFGVDREDAARFGLPCGGRLELLVEELDETGPVDELLARTRDGELTARQVDLDSGQVSLLHAGPGVDFRLSGNRVTRTFGPAWQLLLIGDGQLARHLAGMARQLGYRVIVCEPREAFRTESPVDGVAYTSAMPDDAVLALGERLGRTAVVTLAHDPRQDELALTAALESAAFYIGALGSRRTAEARLRRLSSLNYTAAQLARIHGPAGLEIGSKRPAEIALSILAEITATRNGLRGDGIAP
jgi:xanthine dehydrogenase accessory factor